MNPPNPRPALERLFRQYHQLCTQPSPDVLFGFLNALHSSSDQLHKSHGHSFHALPEFPALKALRNLLHHQADLPHALRVHPAAGLRPLVAELLLVCLVPADVIDSAIAAVPKKWRANAEKSRQCAFKQWGRAVDIYPAIFNVMVRVFELEQELDLRLQTPEHEAMRSSYAFEKAQGFGHFVEGGFSTAAGSVEDILHALLDATPKGP